MWRWVRAARAVVALAAVVVCVAGEGRRGHPEPFEETDLRQVVPASEAARFPTLQVRAMRYSPDGKRIAVVAGRRRTIEGGRLSLLIVLVVGHPRPAVQIWAIPDAISDAWGASPSVKFNWSPDGKQIFAGSEILSVDGGRSCVLQPESLGGGFFAPGDVLSIPLWNGSPADWHRQGGYSYAKYDSECKLEYKLDSRGLGELLDISPDRGLVAVRHEAIMSPVSAEDEVWLLDPAGQKVRNRIQVGLGGDAFFADRGRVLCGTVGEKVPDRSPVRCWEVDDGRLVAEAKGVNLGDPFVAAPKASRVLLSDYQYTRDPLSSYETSTVLRRRLIWDFRSNKMIVWWKGGGAVPLGIRRSAATEEGRRYALSPDGRVLAEGEGSVIRFYRLPQ